MKSHSLSPTRRSPFDRPKFFFYNELQASSFNSFVAQFKKGTDKAELDKQVFKLITEMIYLETYNNLSEFEGIADDPELAEMASKGDPSAIRGVMFEQNKLHFSKLLVKSAKLQEFYARFRHQLKGIIEEEFRENMPQLKHFLTSPKGPTELTSSKEYFPSMRRQANYEFDENMKQFLKIIDKRDDLAAVVRQTGEEDPNKFNYSKMKQNQMKRLHGIDQAKLNFLKQQSKKISDAVINQRLKQQKLKMQQEEMGGENMPKVKMALSNDIIDKMRKKRKMLLQMAKTAKKHVKTEFEAMVESSTKKLNSLIVEADDNNQDLKFDITDVENEMNWLQKQISPKDPSMALSVVPGEKLRLMLHDWAEQEVYTKQDIKNYAAELWLSLGEYEQEMKGEIKGHEMILRKKERAYQAKIRTIQSQASMYIEAKDSAMVELKMNYRRQVDQAEMYASELESRIMALCEPTSKISDMINKYDKQGYSLRNTTEARVIIAEMVQAVKQNYYQNITLKKQIRIKDATIEQKLDQIRKLKAELETFTALANFYQGFSFNTIVALDLFKSDEGLRRTMKDLKVRHDRVEELASRKVLMEDLAVMPIERDIRRQKAGLDEMKATICQLAEKLAELRVVDHPDDEHVDPKATDLPSSRPLLSPKSGLGLMQQASQSRRNSVRSNFFHSGSPGLRSAKRQMEPRTPVIPLEGKREIRRLLESFEIKGVTDILNMKRPDQDFGSPFVPTPKIAPDPLSRRGTMVAAVNPISGIQPALPIQGGGQYKKRLLNKQGTVTLKSKDVPSAGQISPKKKEEPKTSPVKKLTNMDSNIFSKKTARENQPVFEGIKEEESAMKMAEEEDSSSIKMTKSQSKFKVFAIESKLDSLNNEETSAAPHTPNLQTEEDQTRQVIHSEDDSSSRDSESESEEEVKSKVKNSLQIMDPRGRSNARKEELSRLSHQPGGKFTDVRPHESSRSPGGATSQINFGSSKTRSKKPEQASNIALLSMAMDKIYKAKYSAKVKELSAFLKEPTDGDDLDTRKEKHRFTELLNMKAVTMQEFSDTVKASLGDNVPFDDIMALFQQKFEVFVDKLNDLTRDHFNQESLLKKAAKAAKPSSKGYASKDGKLPIFDGLRALHGPNCELIGFELDKNLMPLLYKQESFTFDKMKRLVRCNILLNRILHEGLEKDLELIESMDLPSEHLVSEEDLQTPKVIHDEDNPNELSPPKAIQQTPSRRSSPLQSTPQTKVQQRNMHALKNLQGIVEYHLINQGLTFHPDQLAQVKGSIESIQPMNFLNFKLSELELPGSTDPVSVESYLKFVFSNVEQRFSTKVTQPWKKKRRFDLSLLFSGEKEFIDEINGLKKMLTSKKKYAGTRVHMTTQTSEWKPVDENDEKLNRISQIQKINHDQSLAFASKFEKLLSKFKSQTHKKGIFEYIVSLELEKTLIVFDEFVAHLEQCQGMLDQFQYEENKTEEDYALEVERKKQEDFLLFSDMELAMKSTAKDFTRTFEKFRSRMSHQISTMKRQVERNPRSFNPSPMGQLATAYEKGHGSSTAMHQQAEASTWSQLDSAARVDPNITINSWNPVLKQEVRNQTAQGDAALFPNLLSLTSEDECATDVIQVDQGTRMSHRKLVPSHPELRSIKKKTQRLTSQNFGLLKGSVDHSLKLSTPGPIPSPERSEKQGSRFMQQATSPLSSNFELDDQTIKDNLISQSVTQTELQNYDLNLKTIQNSSSRKVPQAQIPSSILGKAFKRKEHDRHRQTIEKLQNKFELTNSKISFNQDRRPKEMSEIITRHPLDKKSKARKRVVEGFFKNMDLTAFNISNKSSIDSIARPKKIKRKPALFTDGSKTGGLTSPFGSSLQRPTAQQSSYQASARYILGQESSTLPQIQTQTVSPSRPARGSKGSDLQLQFQRAIHGEHSTSVSEVK